MTGQTISHYEILDELGRGGMGVVYRAKDTKLDRIVALKFLPKEVSDNELSRQRFMTEARASAKLTHANICAIHEVNEENDQLFMVMECIEGVTLKERLEEGPLPVDTAIAFGIQIAKGLDRAHESGITHRDIKPANIMVTSRDEIKILDFGLAKFAGGVDITKSGSTIGTAAYMSPEQMRGEEIDHRADIWALGATLYEMLAGRRPFGGDYEAAVGYAILNEEPEPLEQDLPEGLVEVVSRCLAKKSVDRYQSAMEFLTDLAPLTSGIGTTTSREAASTSAKKLNPLVGAAAVLLLVAVVWFVARPETPSDSLSPTASVVVFPFNVQGDPELQVLGAGLVTTVSYQMDEIGGITMVDPNRVLARVDSDSNPVFDPDETGELAASLFANRFVLGSVITTGSRSQLIASIYELDGTEVGEARKLFDSKDELPAAIDALVLDLIRVQLEEDSPRSAELVSATTTSFEALRYLLEAEKSLRRADNARARDLADLAISHDSTLGAAWYIRAQAWSNMTSDAAPYYDEVEPFKGSLPPRLRRLYEIRQSDENREPLLRAFLRDYPNDVQATYRLADNVFHAAPFRFESASEAIRLFEQVREIDPNNAEGLNHTYTQLLRDRELETADSLRLKYSPENEDWAILFNLARGDSAEIAEMALDLTTGARDDFDIWPAAVSDLWNSIAKMYDQVDPEPGESRSRLFYRNVSLLATGQISKSALGTRIEDGPSSITRAYWSLAPHIATDHSVLTEGDFQALGWLAGSDSAKEAIANRMLVSADEVQDVALYSSALFNLRKGDGAIADERYEDLEARAKELGAQSLAHHLLLRLDGLRYFENGQFEQAVDALTRGLDYKIERGNLRTPLSMDAVARSTRAEALAALGRHEEAIATYRSLNDGFMFVDGAWIGPGYLRRAQWYEELGDTNSAIDFYGRFVELWADADPELQPQVEDARQRLDELVLQQASEPQ